MVYKDCFKVLHLLFILSWFEAVFVKQTALCPVSGFLIIDVLENTQGISLQYWVCDQELGAAC